MPRTRPIPAGAVPRYCARCRKHFKAMTDEQWRVNQQLHILMSVRHKRSADADGSSTPSQPTPESGM